MGKSTYADAEVVARGRAGDDDAILVLRERYGRAAYRLARTYPGAGSPDDLVHQAFDLALGDADGLTPESDGPFLTHLFVALRWLAAGHPGATRSDPPDERRAPGTARHPLPPRLRHEPPLAARSPQAAPVLEAFASLPDRMLTVLWQTEVEGRQPRELAGVLDMTPNALVALLDRAREALRLNYLQAMIDLSASPECDVHRRRLVAHVRAGVDGRARTSTAAHVEGCAPCQGLVDDLVDVSTLFVRALVPLFARPPAVASAPVPAGVLAPLRPAAQRLMAGARRVGERTAARARVDTGVALGVMTALVLAIFVVTTTGADAPAPLADAADVTRSSTPEPTRPPPSSAPVPDTPRNGEEGPTTTVGSGPATGGPDPTSVVPEGSAAPTPAPDPTDGPVRVDTTSTTVPASDPPPGPGPRDPPPSTPPSSAPPLPSTSADGEMGGVSSLPSPTVGPVRWVQDESLVRIALANRQAQPTGFLVLSVAALDGAFVTGRPSGCAAGLGFVLGGVCALSPLAPGTRALVDVPVHAAPGQSVLVKLCSGALLRLDCATPMLTPMTIALG